MLPFGPLHSFRQHSIDLLLNSRHTENLVIVRQGRSQRGELLYEAIVELEFLVVQSGGNGNSYDRGKLELLYNLVKRLGRQ